MGAPNGERRKINTFDLTTVPNFVKLITVLVGVPFPVLVAVYFMARDTGYIPSKLDHQSVQMLQRLDEHVATSAVNQAAMRDLLREQTDATKALAKATRQLCRNSAREAASAWKCDD